MCVRLNALVLLNGQTIWPCCQHSIHLIQSTNSNFRILQLDQIQSLFPDNLFVYLTEDQFSYQSCLGQFPFPVTFFPIFLNTSDL